MKYFPFRLFERSGSKKNKLDLGLSGPVNPMTGLGGKSDKVRGIRWTPSAYDYRTLRNIHRESWVAKKAVDLPAMYMTSKWRKWLTPDGNEDARLKLDKLERKLNVSFMFEKAIRRARLFGGSLIIMHLKDAPLDQPLDINHIKEGDLINLSVFDQQSVSEMEWDWDVTSANYGKPSYYTIFGGGGEHVYVHHSRILRFVGEEPMTIDERAEDHNGWGESTLIKMMLEVNNDTTIATSIANLFAQLNILVIKNSNVGELLQAMSDVNYQGEVDIASFFQNVERAISVYDMMLIDSEGDVERIAVQFAGIDKVVDKFLNRIAGAAEIPATLFWGSSPDGMNATGESDHVGLSDYIRNWQRKYCIKPLQVLDPVLYAAAGIKEELEYMFPEYYERDTGAVATETHETVKAISLALGNGLIDEDEARAILDGNPIFGTLKGPAPGLPEMDIDEPVKDAKKKKESKDGKTDK